jgi:ABC-type amino acid transport system permease subunit
MDPREFFLAEARSKATAMTLLTALAAVILWYLYAVGGDEVLARLALAGAIIATVACGGSFVVAWLAALAVVVVRHTPVTKAIDRH